MSERADGRTSRAQTGRNTREAAAARAASPCARTSSSSSAPAPAGKGLRAEGRRRPLQRRHRRQGDLDGHPPQRRHRADRPLGLRQEHPAALPQPDERPDPRRRGARASCSTTARTSTGRTSTRSQVRKLIGMVFQKPNPFPKSIYDNVAFGPRILGDKENLDETGREGAARRRRSGTRSRTGSRTTPSASPAASSSGSASPAASPSSPR